ncbi:hypothetical protein D3C73_1582420 [compost metagenome]
MCIKFYRYSYNWASVEGDGGSSLLLNDRDGQVALIFAAAINRVLSTIIGKVVTRGEEPRPISVYVCPLNNYPK